MNKEIIELLVVPYGRGQYKIMVDATNTELPNFYVEMQNIYGWDDDMYAGIIAVRLNHTYPHEKYRIKLILLDSVLPALNFATRICEKYLSYDVWIDSEFEMNALDVFGKVKHEVDNEAKAD